MPTLDAWTRSRSNDNDQGQGGQGVTEGLCPPWETSGEVRGEGEEEGSRVALDDRQSWVQTGTQSA